MLLTAQLNYLMAQSNAIIKNTMEIYLAKFNRNIIIIINIIRRGRIIVVGLTPPAPGARDREGKYRK